MRRTLLLLAITPCIFQLAVLPAQTSAPSGPTPSKPRPEPKNDAGGVPYWGAVTELTKDSITIRHAEEKPKRFSVSETLAAGKIPAEPRPIPNSRQPYLLSASDMYRLADVKVGDLVIISYSSVGGVITCDHICIQKRPGGRVPPLPEEAEALRRPSGPFPPGFTPRPHIRYDEYMNAYWDLEDKGIPYPEKFGRARRFPVAPPPREVARRPAMQ